MARPDSRSPWDGVSFPYPGVPTMISEEERRYLYWLGSEVWSGEGHVVEMGPWLGGSTTCLAMGMRTRGPAAAKLHAVDSFVWRAFMAERAPLPLAEGASFRPYFERNLAPFRDIVVTHEASLPDEDIPSDPLAAAIRDAEPTSEVLRWDAREPIEILFVDGAKSWTAIVHLLRETAPSLLASKALVVCQDYKYWGAYWVPLALERLMEHLELVHVLERNTVAFRVRERVPASSLDALPAFSELDRERSLAALGRAGARLGGRGDRLGASILEVAAVRLLANLGYPGEARAALRRAERRWPAGGSAEQLERARGWLAESLGEPVPPAPGYRARRRVRRFRRRAAAAARRLRPPLSSPHGRADLRP